MKPKIPTRNTFEKQFHNTRWTIEFSSTTTHSRHTTVDPWKELCKPSSWVRYIASGIDCRQNHNFFYGSAMSCHTFEAPAHIRSLLQQSFQHLYENKLHCRNLRLWVFLYT